MMFSSKQAHISYLSQMMPYANQQLLFDDHNNSAFGQENGGGLNPISHFPSSSYDHGGFDDLPPAVQLTMPAPPPPLPPPPPPTSTCVARRSGRKRVMRRDRHSKIVTANGPRDRRMRLSLEVARKFFELQDVLGFDKASHTVEWLLNKSKGAIRSLTACGSKSEHRRSGGGGNAKTESSCSECEVDKPVVMDDEDVDHEERAVAAAAGDQLHAPHKSRRPTTTRSSRKPTSDPLTKESRAKARARARERTMEKRMWSSRFENGTLQKQHLGGEVEHPNVDDWKRTSPTLGGGGGGGQAPPAVVMGHVDDYAGLISTSDLNYNHHHSLLHLLNQDPFNSSQEYWSLHAGFVATADATGEQRATADAQIQGRGWEEDMISLHHGGII